MKPTEADIQAELIEGWEINDILHEDEGSTLRFVIITNPSLRIEIYSPVSFGNIDFYHGDLEDDVCKDVSLSDFLSGNYDLSAISQYYDPEEWQRIITMCESIVRLITGEPEKKESVLIKNVKSILRKNGLGEWKAWYAKNGLILNLETDQYRLEIGGNFGEVSENTVTYILGEPYGNEFSADTEDFCDDSSILPNMADAVREISALHLSMIKNSKTEQPKQTLEEKVREILEPAADISELKVTDHSVEFLDNCNPPIRYFVTHNQIGFVPDAVPNSRCNFTVEEYKTEYQEIPAINAALPKVAALLTEQPEQTLEEAVRDEIMRWNIIKPPRLDVFEDHVILDYQHTEYKVFDNCLVVDGETGEFDQISKKKRLTHEFTECMKSIAALLSTRSTKPSYSDLEQRVEELELQNGNLIIDAAEYNKAYSDHLDQINDLRNRLSNSISLNIFECETKRLEKRIRELARENSSLLDKFGPIDQAEQQVAEVETRFQKLAKKAERIADLLIQLNEEIL